MTKQLTLNASQEDGVRAQRWQETPPIISSLSYWVKPALLLLYKLQKPINPLYCLSYFELGFLDLELIQRDFSGRDSPADF